MPPIFKQPGLLSGYVAGIKIGKTFEHCGFALRQPLDASLSPRSSAEFEATKLLHGVALQTVLSYPRRLRKSILCSMEGDSAWLAAQSVPEDARLLRLLGLYVFLHALQDEVILCLLRELDTARAKRMLSFVRSVAEKACSSRSEIIIKLWASEAGGLDNLLDSCIRITSQHSFIAGTIGFLAVEDALGAHSDEWKLLSVVLVNLAAADIEFTSLIEKVSGQNRQSRLSDAQRENLKMAIQNAFILHQGPAEEFPGQSGPLPELSGQDIQSILDNPGSFDGIRLSNYILEFIQFNRGIFGALCGPD